MLLKAKPIDFEAGGKGVVVLNRADAEALGVHNGDRVAVRRNRHEMIAIVDVSDKFASVGEVVTNDELNHFFNMRSGENVEIIPTPTPLAVSYIKQKIAGDQLDYSRILSIVQDVVCRKLSETEVAAFVSALEMRGLSMDEAEHLSKAMIATGQTLKIDSGKKPIVDKHSVGGIPGDKTSLVAVPIIASAGLIIPKTSSRAITSPSGTADRMEVLAPVEHSPDEIRRIVKRTGGCLVWGGALALAPADDLFIRVEYPLGIDPLMLPSIMSKKHAVGSKYVVIDIPAGRGAKIKTVGEGHKLAGEFVELGRRMGMHVACGITFGEQPLGHTMGPALEAQEALYTLQGKGPMDVVEKVASIVGILFDMIEKDRKPGKEVALDLLKSGKAEKKMRQIIDAQGGNPKIRPDDIAIGEKVATVKSERDGRVLWIKNAEIAAIAREAGAPRDKGAGIRMGPKMGFPVKKGETLFTIHAHSAIKLQAALKMAEEYMPYVVGKQFEEKMLLDKIPSKIPHRRMFTLER